MKKLILTISIIVFCAIVGEARLVQGAFADIGLGARAAGMGYAFTSIANDATAVVWNPAGITQLERNEVVAMNAKQKGLVEYNFAALGYRLSTMTGSYLGAGLITSGDSALSEKTVIISYAQSMLSGEPAYDGMPAGFNLGASYKTYLADYGNNEDGGDDRIRGTAKGSGIDAGVIYKYDEFVAIGFCAHDIISDIAWQPEGMSPYSESLLKRLVLGLSYRNIYTELMLGFDFDNYGVINAGIEKGIYERFMIRAGMRIDTRKKTENDEYYAGFGLADMQFMMSEVSFDFAYCYENIENTLKISSTIKF